jgi:hypothetical protein
MYKLSGCGHTRAASRKARGQPYKRACAIALQKGLREARRAAFSLLHAATLLAFAARERARSTDHNREDPLGGDGVNLTAMHAAIAVGNCWGDLRRRSHATLATPRGHSLRTCTANSPSFLRSCSRPSLRVPPSLDPSLAATATATACVPSVGSSGAMGRLSPVRRGWAPAAGGSRRRARPSSLRSPSFSCSAARRPPWRGAAPCPVRRLRGRASIRPGGPVQRTLSAAANTVRGGGRSAPP